MVLAVAGNAHVLLERIALWGLLEMVLAPTVRHATSAEMVLAVAGNAVYGLRLARMLLKSALPKWGLAEIVLAPTNTLHVC